MARRKKTKSLFNAFDGGKGKKSLFNAFDKKKGKSLFNAFDKKKGKSLFNAFDSGKKGKKSLFNAFDKGKKKKESGGLFSGWGAAFGNMFGGGGHGDAMSQSSYVNAVSSHDMKDNPQSLLYYAMRFDREEDVVALIADVKRTKGNKLGIPISALDFSQTDQVLETWRKYKLNPSFYDVETRIRKAQSEQERWTLVNQITGGDYRSVPRAVWQYLSTLASPTPGSRDTTDLV